MSRIPKTLHYCYFKPDFADKPWSLVHYVCVKSAIQRIKPEAAFFYYENEPQGPWWELSKPLLRPTKITAPREIFGRALVHPAHRADVVRLQMLLEHGGIYLDTDVFVHRDFDDLLDNSCVIGQEGIDASEGLSNAVLLAERGVSFLQRWYEEYHWFRSKGRDEYWNEHSIKLPLKFAAQYPREVTVLPYTAFHWPLWTGNHLAWIYESGQPPIPNNAYANHLWESAAWDKYLNYLTPGQVRRGKGHFHAWARPLLDTLPDDFGGPSALQKLQANIPSFGRATRARLRTVRERLRRLRARS
jgi:hypothetical protein